MRYAIEHWPPTRQDIEEIVNLPYPESQVLEFKRTNISDDKEGVPFLKSVCGFANSSGGHLIMGIEEAEGVAATIFPIEVRNPDALVRGLLSKIRLSTTPPVLGVKVECIEVVGGHVVAVQVPKSNTGPHMLTKSKTYYIRNTTAAEPMLHHELRDAFLAQDAQSERLRTFRDERIKRIMEGDVPFNVLGSSTTFTQPSTIVLHVFPQDLRPNSNRHDVANLRDELLSVLLVRNVSGDYRGVDLDGAHTSKRFHRDDAVAGMMMMRSGACELIDRYSLGEGREINHGAMDSTIGSALLEMLELLSRIGEEPPFVVFLSLLHASGAHSDEMRHLPVNNRPNIRHPIVKIHEVIFERVPTSWKEATLG